MVVIIHWISNVVAGRSAAGWRVAGWRVAGLSVAGWSVAGRSVAGRSVAEESPHWKLSKLLIQIYKIYIYALHADFILFYSSL